MQDISVKQVRRFNRLVAERVGALDRRYLGRTRPIGEARTLWEIGPEGVEVRDLRSRLSLDSGYLSRLLRSLERQGLVSVVPSPEDGRVRRVRLTRAGLAERDELDRRSDELAGSFLRPLTESQRKRLVAAMEEVERLLLASMVRFAVEDPAGPDARWCVNQYFNELNARFETGYDRARGDSAGDAELTSPAGALLLVRLRERPIGCGAIRFHPGEVAELKHIWISPDARGLGVGRRLLQALEEYAREAGAAVVRLDTNRALSEAIQLYLGAGYHEIPPFNTNPYAHHWFEKRLA